MGVECGVWNMTLAIPLSLFCTPACHPLLARRWFRRWVEHRRWCVLCPTGCVQRFVCRRKFLPPLRSARQKSLRVYHVSYTSHIPRALVACMLSWILRHARADCNSEAQSPCFEGADGSDLRLPVVRTNIGMQRRKSDIRGARKRRTRERAARSLANVSIDASSGCTQPEAHSFVGIAGALPAEGPMDAVSSDVSGCGKAIAIRISHRPLISAS